jgi:hypothetical protein
MKKIIVASLTLAFASAAQSAVLLEKIVERTYKDMNSSTQENPMGIERTVKKTCSIQDDKKMVIKYETGGLVSSVTYSLQIDKNLIAKKIAAVDSEVQVNGKIPYPPMMGYISIGGDPYGINGSKSAFYVGYNKKIKVSLLNYKPMKQDENGDYKENPETYKANSETATNLKNFMDLTCDNLPTITESSGVQ